MEKQKPQNIEKQSSARAKWVRLDNASKVFPATANYQDTKVFRVAAELNEAVDPEILQQALDAIMPRFPSFNAVLRRGVFWYYFEQSERRSIVQPETEDLYEPLYIRGERRLPFRVLYYGSRISAEIFHAVCDGAVAVAFVRALLGQYLLLRHPETIRAEDIQPLFERSPAGEKMSDSFKRYFKNDVKLKSKIFKSEGKKKRVRAWKYKGTPLLRNRANLIEGSMPIKAVLDAAKRRKATLTVYISAIYARAIWETRDGDKPRPIVLAIPVNLRSLFRSRTERNFFKVMHVELPEPAEEEALDLDWWIAQISDAFSEALQAEKLAADSAELLKLEANPAVRILPTGLKDLSLRIAHRFSDRKQTSSISNVGRLDLPEKLCAYVRSCYASVATRGISMSALSCAGKFTVSFISIFRETDLQYRFFTALKEEGVPIEITSNRNIITADSGGENGEAALMPSAEGLSPGGTTTCPNCGCDIRGYKAMCPLDNEPLQVSADARLDDARDVFPPVEQKFNRRLLTRLFVFISLAALVLSIIVDYSLELPLNLPLMTLLGIISTWASVGAAVIRRRQVSKIVTWQVTILSLLVLIWDWMLGWQGWSLNYAIPIILLAAQATLYILARALHLESGDYMVYLLLCAVLGLVPLLFLIFGWVTIQLPSVICVGVSLLMIVGAIIFQGGVIKHELSKRLHI
ncbi:MAG: DUF6320 domain-containing protein [Eubacteriales bacterium]|nr:DUF6320 domain-containing protein [Eubacteriales bacterium]